jgi:hypothetical protein
MQRASSATIAWGYRGWLTCARAVTRTMTHPSCIKLQRPLECWNKCKWHTIRQSQHTEQKAEKRCSVVVVLTSSGLCTTHRYGRIPLIHGKGEWGRTVTNIIKHNRQADDDKAAAKARVKAKLKATTAIGSCQETRCKPSAASIDAKIGRILFLDRTVDLITPLLSQCTYEGLLDEVCTLRFRM